jgi:hypothetical protein
LAFKVEDIKSTDNRFLYDKAKIILTNAVIDLADIPRVVGTVVLGGKAFHLALPSIPEFLRKQYESLFALDAVRCAKTEEQYELHINRISNDKGRSKHTALFVLPDGFAFSDDFSVADASPSIMDRTMHISMRSLGIEKAVEVGGQSVAQHFYPAFFELRVLSCDAASKALKSNSGVTSFASYFSGMKVDATETQGEPTAKQY